MYLKIITMFAAMLLSVTLAHADCETRHTTQAERDFSVKTLTAVKKAMPAAPVDWKIDNESRISAVESTCRGENYPVEINYTISYRRIKPTPAMKELRAANVKRADERRKLKKEYEKSPEHLKNKADLEEVLKRRSEAGKRWGEARRKNDKTAEKKADEESKKLVSEQMALIEKDNAFYGKIIAEENADRAAEDKDTHTEITVQINEYDPYGMKDAKPFTPTNAQAAYSWDYPPYQGSFLTMTSIHLFYGDWTSKDNSEGKKVFSPVFAKNTKAATAPHIYIKVTANDSGRAEELAKKIDLDAIKTLISK